jgi:hypothetical protein
MLLLYEYFIFSFSPEKELNQMWRWYTLDYERENEKNFYWFIFRDHGVSG